MACYTIDEVKIDGVYPVQKILEISMELGVNRHGLLTYGGLVSQDAAKQYIQQSADGQVVKVFLRDELEFCGYPQTITAEHQNDHVYLCVTLVTSSQLMDNDPCDRFFQDTSRTYANILTEAYEDSKAGDLVAVKGNESIRKPILQYHETDWQFTLRMASCLCTTVFPDVTSEQPQITLGIPNRPIINETNDIVYSVARHADKFRRKYADYDSSFNIGYQNFLYYKMQSNNRCKLGDRIKIDGKVLTVMQKNLKYEQGEIQEQYILGHEQEFAVPLYYNKRLAGLELEGVVLDRSGQEMQVLFDIDTNRKDYQKTWFSYAPVTNNGMYSMPLENEKVMLQWQSELDHDVLIVRPERKNSHDMLDPGERHFLTEHKNHMMMIPQKVEYTNPVGSIKWLAQKGLDISTEKNILISAQRDVVIQAQAQVDVASPERITLCKAGVESSIDMLASELHIKAMKKVKISSKANQYKKTKLPDRTQSFAIKAKTQSKLAAGIARSN